MSESLHPWQRGPAELLSRALKRLSGGSDADRREAFIQIDCSVEAMFKSYLARSRPDLAAAMSHDRRKLHELVSAVRVATRDSLGDVNLDDVTAFHLIRNTLQHEAAGVTVDEDHAYGYARLAVGLLRDLLDVDLSEELRQAKSSVRVREPVGERRTADSGRPDQGSQSRLTFTIKSVGSVRMSRKGNKWLECETTVGKVAFWGTESNQSNIRLVQRLHLPMSVTAECFKPKSSQYDLWVPEHAQVILHEQQG